MSGRRSVRFAVWGLGAAMLFAAPAVAQYEPVLTLEGTCPGVLRAEVSGAPPRHGVYLLFSAETGSFQIPPDYQYCRGVVLGLGPRQLRQVAAANTDEFGFVEFHGLAGPRACGGFLQALTTPLGGCLTSNVVQIE